MSIREESIRMLVGGGDSADVEQLDVTILQIDKQVTWIANDTVCPASMNAITIDKDGYNPVTFTKQTTYTTTNSTKVKEILTALNDGVETTEDDNIEVETSGRHSASASFNQIRKNSSGTWNIDFDIISSTATNVYSSSAFWAKPLSVKNVFLKITERTPPSKYCNAIVEYDVLLDRGGGESEWIHKTDGYVSTSYLDYDSTKTTNEYTIQAKTT